MKKIIVLFMVGMLVFTGCSKEKGVDSELQIMGDNTKNIEKIEIIHGNTILYPDLEQKDHLTLIEDLKTAFENTGDEIEALDENLGIAFVDAEAYAQKDADNYYVFIPFSNQQTLYFNSSKKEIQNCDGILFDLSKLKLYWSRDGKFVGTMGYSNNLTSVEREFSTFYHEIDNLFDELDH